jgi:2-polyprenyl-3-methyl-5-hydroxy-6-metoxy-1,4-benzoquinol methylase
MKSIITQGKSNFYARRANVSYYRCADTGSLFASKELEQSHMVGGTGEEERNAEHNPTRLQRIGIRGKVLDFGCGKGTFVSYLKSNGVDADGYDAHSKEYNAAPLSNTYDTVTCIEVIEHLYAPFNEFKVMFDALKEGGMLYIESSFSDWVDKDHPYFNPKIGHGCIFSHKGLTHVLAKVGFKEGQHINNNVRVYHK